jgi:preprotein translocase subunit SecF
VVVLHMLAPITGYPLRIDLNIIAALLTITGFSVNDTIVVFDRIREVKHAHPTRSYEEIVNEAVNATLSRTILTSLTVLLADAALLIFGGPTIRGMAYTLLVGFAVGTYSSIFIAAPLMIWWWRKFGAGAGGAAAAPAGERPAKPAAVSPQV